MRDKAEFEKLKMSAIESFDIYIEAIKQFIYEDVKSVNKRISLLNAYTQFVFTNTAYRTFINQLKMKP